MATDEVKTETELADDYQETKVAGGLDENVAGALTYFLGFVTGLIFYLIEEDNEFVRFHAVQSMIVFGGLFVLSFAITFVQIFFELIPYVGWIFSLALGLVSMLLGPIAFVLWIVLLFKAYKGQRYALPGIGDMAEQYM